MYHTALVLLLVLSSCSVSLAATLEDPQSKLQDKIMNHYQQVNYHLWTGRIQSLTLSIRLLGGSDAQKARAIRDDIAQCRKQIVQLRKENRIAPREDRGFDAVQSLTEIWEDFRRTGSPTCDTMKDLIDKTVQFVYDNNSRKLTSKIEMRFPNVSIYVGGSGGGGLRPARSLPSKRPTKVALKHIKTHSVQDLKNQGLVIVDKLKISSSQIITRGQDRYLLIATSGSEGGDVPLLFKIPKTNQIWDYNTTRLTFVAEIDHTSLDFGDFHFDSVIIPITLKGEWYHRWWRVSYSTEPGLVCTNKG